MMENRFKDNNFNIDGNKYKKTSQNTDVSNIKTIAELEKVVTKAKKLGADAIGTYDNHTAVRIAGRWYVPFLRKDQSPDEDPCLRPVSSFNETQNTSNKNISGKNNTNQTMNNNVEFESPSLGDPAENDTEEANKKTSATKEKSGFKRGHSPKESHGFSPLSSDEKTQDSEKNKKGSKKSKKKLL